MKRSALKRKTPMLRISHKRRKISAAISTFASSLVGDGKTKHARRPRALDFMGWTKRQPCMVRQWLDELHAAAGNRIVLRDEDLWCSGLIEADHAGNRFTQGDGKRAYDWTCIPLCKKHHEQRTNAAGTRGQAGIFFGFTCEMLRSWCNEAIRIHHMRARAQGIAIPTC